MRSRRRWCGNSELASSGLWSTGDVTLLSANCRLHPMYQYAYISHRDGVKALFSRVLKGPLTPPDNRLNSTLSLRLLIGLISSELLTWQMNQQHFFVSAMAATCGARRCAARSFMAPPWAAREARRAYCPRSLPRFYVEQSDVVAGSSVHIDGEEAKHAIKVLRLKALDSIEVCDGRGGVARCTIRSAGATTSSGRRERRGFRVTAEVESRRLEPWTGIRWKLCVAGGSVKGARGDWLVEKATELGAHSFQPLLTDRSARMGSRGGSEGGSGREERWKRLAVSASKQCLRPHFLDIEPAITLDDLLLDRDGLGITLAAHQSGDPLLPLLMEHRPRLLSPAERGCLIVGPEGDFSDRELELLRRQDGVSVVGLGDLRLRVETAALSLLSGARLSEGLAAA